MTTALSTANVYTDLQGLGSLRTAAARKSPEALKEVARQFESMMLQMMLKNMRQATLGEGIMDSDQTRLARDLYDRQIATDLAGRSELGLAELIVRQLGGDMESGQKTGKSLDEYRKTALMPVRINPLAAVMPTNPAATGGQSAPVRSVAGSGENVEPETPREFVRTLWPFARQAAQELGASPEVLLAQAALETGWGRSVPRHADGKSSYNLFGIKADQRWDGERVRRSTLEYEDGVAVRKTESFRAYSSWQQAFTDYVKFVRSNPRYQDAVAVAADPRAYPRALQSAGYATDPQYANKIQRILDGDLLNGSPDGA